MAAPRRDGPDVHNSARSRHSRPGRTSRRGSRRDPRGALDLLLSLFRCNDKEIFRELKAAVDRGVDVEVLVTSRAKGGKKKLRKLWQRLQDTGATVAAYNERW